MSLPKTSNELAQDWIKNPDGSYSKRAGAVATVETSRPKLAPIRPLDQGVQKPASGPPCVGYRVCIITLRRRLLDSDAVAYAAKPLRDAIADWLGFANDEDPARRWEYGQQATGGEEGVIVKIQTL